MKWAILKTGNNYKQFKKQDSRSEEPEKPVKQNDNIKANNFTDCNELRHF